MVNVGVLSLSDEQRELGEEECDAHVTEDLLPDNLDVEDFAESGPQQESVNETQKRSVAETQALLARATEVSAQHAAFWTAGTWDSMTASLELQTAFQQLIEVRRCVTSTSKCWLFLTLYILMPGQRLSPGPNYHARRAEVVQLLTVSVERRFKGVTVALFGSQVSGFNLKGSDLDVTLQLHPGSEYHADDPDRQLKHKQKLLRQMLYGVLERHRAVANTLLIPRARVPVLKFETFSGMKGDISVQSDGVFKSHCLRMLADMQPLFRSLVRVVKVWARAHGFNDAAEGTLNSYAWSLLALFHCQCGLPRPLLPPVVLVLCDNPEDVMEEERARAQTCSHPGRERVGVDECRDVHAVARRCTALQAAGFGNDMASLLSLPSLTASFFAHFADMMLLLEQGACPQPFGAMWGVPGPWPARRRLGFAIEDPFDASENPARSTEYDIVFGRMLREVQFTANALDSPPQDAHALRQLAATVFGDANVFDPYNPEVEDISMATPSHSPLGRGGGRGTPGRGGRGRGGGGGRRGPPPPRSPAPAPAQAPGSLGNGPPFTLPKPRLPDSGESPAVATPSSTPPANRRGGRPFYRNSGGAPSGGKTATSSNGVPQ